MAGLFSSRWVNAVVDLDHVKLLFGPYTPPPLERGDRAFCLVRDYAVKIVGWRDSRISWPICCPLDPPRLGRAALLVNEELARAVQNESTVAVAYWWSVTRTVVSRWRRALGVTRKNNAGTYRLVLGAISETLKARFGEAAGDKGKSPFPALGRPAVWTAEEVALLGTLPDAEVAARTGHSHAAVTKKREQQGREAITASGVLFISKFWKPDEDEAVLKLSPEVASRLIGRPLHIVKRRKKELEG